MPVAQGDEGRVIHERQLRLSRHRQAHAICATAVQTEYRDFPVAHLIESVKSRSAIAETHPHSPASNSALLNFSTVQFSFIARCSPSSKPAFDSA